jgi:CelD/BcsL family acetyltransferase involved in cellulose biosynthesis
MVPWMVEATFSSCHSPAVDSVRSAAFASVEVHRTPTAILPAWSELEQAAPCSAYQTRAFALAWLDTIGKARKVTPLFIAARDADGRIVALFCLGIQERRGLRRAVFLGGKESNVNLGLFRTPEAFGRADLEILLRDAAKQLGRDAPDVFLLLNQPLAWRGVPNPCTRLPHQLSPSNAFATLLPRDVERYFAAKQSKERRKKLRKKQARLAEMGEVAHLTNTDSETAQTICAAFIAQKVARCEAQAIDADFVDPAVQSFYTRLGTPEIGRPADLELNALACGSRIVAVFGGMAHRDCFSGMIVSFDADAEIARSSPGELLLTRVIATQIKNAIAQFDLGIGEADYKATYCEMPIALFDTVFAITFKGRLSAACEALRLRLKRSVKQRLQLLAALRRAKRALRRARR